MKSNLIFYNVDFTFDKNALIDEDFSSYLESKKIGQLLNFQYQRNASELRVKIVSPQENLELEEDNNFGNYVSIRNVAEDDEEEVEHITFYYFITNPKQVSANTVELTLTLDRLNTFPVGTYYDFSGKTIINREHKDRVLNSYYTDGDGNRHYRRLIDKVPENVNAEMLKISEENITESNSGDWYIMYESENAITQETQNSPVNIYFLTDDDNLYVPASAQRQYEIEPSEFYSATSPWYQYFFGVKLSGTLSNATIKITDENGTIRSYNLEDGLYSIYTDYNGSAWDYKYKIRFEKFRDYGLTPIFNGLFLQLNSKIIIETEEYMPQLFKMDRDKTGFNYTQFTVEQSAEFIRTHVDAIKALTPTSNYVKLDTFSTVDRTNTKLLKIIKLPYAPFNISISVDSGRRVLNVPSNVEVTYIQWEAGASPKYYLKVHKEYTGLFVKDLNTDIAITEQLFTTFGETDERNDVNESKILSSEYKYKKFVYDSFAFIFKNEDLLNDSTVTPTDKLNAKFIVSSSMTTRFMFDFKSLKKLYNTEDYNDILTVARNNEVQLYNSNYLNYIRNGYNYDVKNKNQAVSASLLGLGVGAVGSILAGNFVGAGLALAGGAVGTINNVAQSENSIEGRLAQLRAQSVSVSGSDDLDLLTYYTGNRAKVCEYQASERTINNALNTFYYFGYNSLRLGVPELKTRKWFNYISANAVFININKEVLPYLADIVELWKNGVTVYHNGGTTDFPSYDFEQTTANNELFI